MEKLVAISCLLLVALYLSLFSSVVSLKLNYSIDELSLLSIKTQINSDPNNILSTNWSKGTLFCTWIGIKCCRRHMRVTSLNLFKMNLEGTVAPEIGNLSFLTYLSVGNNSFKGAIPGAIGNLLRLRTLNMSFNQLSGQIPQSLGSLRNLRVLRLLGNHLSGSIPLNIFNISSLQQINLAVNQLTGTLPFHICQNLPNLKSFNVWSNQLSGQIPTDLSACKELKYLDLSENKLSGSIPMTIGNLSRLQRLYLDHNDLTGEIPSSLMHCQSLKQIMLNENNLIGIIPAGIGNLSELRSLEIGYNHLHGRIPWEIGFLPRLEWFSVIFNSLKGEVPHSIFNISSLQVLQLLNNELSGTLPSSIWIPNLQILNIASNQFSGEIPISISNLSNLVSLGLNNNSFGGKIPINLGKLQRLKRIRLWDNQFSNDLDKPDEEFITSLTNCNYLINLYFSINWIRGSLPNSLGSSNFSTSLQMFSASRCRISGKIPSAMGNLSNLIGLYLFDNELTGQIPMSFGDLMEIQVLSLRKNKLQGSFSHALCKLKKLYAVSLSDNILVGDLPECVVNLSSLRHFYVYRNSLSSIIPSALWCNSRILKIDMSQNFFRGSIPPELGNMKSLLSLKLSGNLLSGSIPSTIGQLQSATYLSLSNNKLQGPIPTSIANLKNLQFLDLSRNHINGTIPMSLETLRYLEYFNVSFNELSGEIPDKGPFLNFTSGFFEGNKGLCGAFQFHVQPCAVKKSGNTRALRYTLPITAVVVIVIVILVILFMKKRYKKLPLPHTVNLPLGIEHDRISYYEILHATNNFDAENIIGKGSLGTVYKGIFSDTMTAAVKVFNLQVQCALLSFDRECLILRSIRHRNLVKVITSCSNLDFKALVLEYMPNGNLDTWLHQDGGFLNVRQRLSIMVDIAHAVEYLHHGCSFSIVHCDLKPNNILLDEDMVAHVSDFGISKLLKEDHLRTHTKALGTVGYVAPEFGATGLVSTKADIYSYGILLMEIFTKKKPVDNLFSAEMTMPLWVRKSFPNATMQIVDHGMFHASIWNRVQINYERYMTLIMGLALKCTTDIPRERIDMKDVLVRLKKIQIEIEQA